VELLGLDTQADRDSVKALWKHAIVLREQHGVGLVFSRLEESRWSTIGLRSGQVEERTVTIRLEPYSEVRITVEDDLAFQEGAPIAGRSEHVLTGKDDRGHEVRVSVMIPLLSGPPLVPQRPDGPPSSPAVSDKDPSRLLLRRGPAASLVVVAVVNGRHRVSLLLDTGATRTILSPRTLDNIGVKVPADAPRVTFTVAGGQRGEAAVIPLESLELGTSRVSPLDVLVFDVAPDSPVLDGVLGLDVLSQFTVTIDQATNTLLIAPRPSGK
jgi:hypothetical protein